MTPPTPGGSVEMLRQFAEFAAGKPAGQEYDWGNPTACAVAQFARTIGTTYGRLYGRGGQALDLIAVRSPHTFGALSSRLTRALLDAERGE